jgi:hypothetical protein
MTPNKIVTMKKRRGLEPQGNRNITVRERRWSARHCRLLQSPAREPLNLIAFRGTIETETKNVMFAGGMMTEITMIWSMRQQRGHHQRHQNVHFAMLDCEDGSGIDGLEH